MSCSSDEQSDKECPLCMEPLELDDLNFYPCKCEYQICRFCWHRIRTDENGLCPACRQPYPEDPANFKPLSTADLQKMKSEKKMKQQAEKQRISESRKHLSSYRVLQKNLVYVIGLSARVADQEVLKRMEYFGKYGKICKVAVGTTTSGGCPGQTSHTAYVTYSKVEEALRAIQGVQNAVLDGRVVKASLGTTKYCSSFLRSQQCYKPECMYLHDLAEQDISFTKEDMHLGKHTEYEKRLLDNMMRQQQAAFTQPLKNNTVNNKQSIGNLNGQERRDADDKSEDLQIPIQSNIKIEECTKRENTIKRERKDSERIDVEPLCLPVPLDLSASPPDDWTSRDDSSYSPPPPMSLPSHSPPPPISLPSQSPPLPISLPSHSASQSTSSKLAHHTNGCMTPLDEGKAPEWQTLLGLTPRIPSPPLNGFCSDDDLGFDPYAESSKELAALVEEERKQRDFAPSPLAYNDHFGNHSHSWLNQHGLGMTGNDPRIGHYNIHTMPANVNDRMREMEPSQCIPTSYNGIGTMDSSPLDPYPFHSVSSHSFTRLSAMDLLQPSRTVLDGYSSHLTSHDAPPGLYGPPLSSFPPPPPGLGPPRLPIHRSVPQQPVERVGMAEWQEGFKALLPNVNVRFAAELERG